MIASIKAIKRNDVAIPKYPPNDSTDDRCKDED
jgi:hypothetical protein